MPNKIDPTGCPVPPEDTNPDYCGAIGKDCKDFQSLRVRVAELERVMRPLLNFSYEANHEKWIKAKAEAAEVLTRK